MPRPRWCGWGSFAIRHRAVEMPGRALLAYIAAHDIARMMKRYRR